MTYTEIDPFEGAPEGYGGDKWLEEQGWDDFLTVGGEMSDLRIRTFRRAVDGRCEYMLDVWDVNSGSPFIKVDGFGELMDLIARWAPAVQAASVVAMLDRAQDYSLDQEGAVETIAAKAAFGATVGLNALEKHQREQRARREEIQRQRSAQRS